MTNRNISERPKSVVTAAKLLYVVLAIGLVRTVEAVIRHMDVRSPNFLVATKLLIYAAGAFLIYQVCKGKNWARWSLLMLLTASIPLSVLPAYDSLSHSPFQALLVFVQLVLYVTGMVLLFRNPASAWIGSEGKGVRVN